MHLARVIGSTLIVTGTAVGAGMLAIPLVSGGPGFLWSMIALVLIWALMTYTALLILEVCLALPPYKNNFNSMAQVTLGRPGQVVAWITVLVLLYALTSAYIAGASSLLTEVTSHVLHWEIPGWVNAILFTLVFGGLVYSSTRTVDVANRFLISLKGITLLVTVVLMIPQINFVKLAGHGSHINYIWAVGPIFLTSFGFHTVIPSLANYMGKKASTLKWVIIWGAFIPLVVYILWLVATLGVVPLQGKVSFTALAQHHGSVGLLIQYIDEITKNKWVILGINGFSNIAVTTSFLGVSLGLFDFLADGFNRKNTRGGRTQTMLITFLPPLAFALFYPQGFIMALGYAAICVAVLEVVMPALMVWQLRKSKTLRSPYRVKGNTAMLFFIVLVGLVLIGLQIASDYHALPLLH